ncbi:MAG: RNA chaperone Hfq [Pseudomonadota bacterium]
MNDQLLDGFLQHLVETEKHVSIFLVNGVQLKGKINEFGLSCLCLCSDFGDQLVMFHAISTIQPGRYDQWRL